MVTLSRSSGIFFTVMSKLEVRNNRNTLESSMNDDVMLTSFKVLWRARINI